MSAGRRGSTGDAHIRIGGLSSGHGPLLSDPVRPVELRKPGLADMEGVRVIERPWDGPLSPSLPPFLDVPPLQSTPPPSLLIGTPAAVKSESAGGWTLGRVTHSKKPGVVTVEFDLGGVPHRKSFHGATENLRVFPPEVDDVVLVDGDLDDIPPSPTSLLPPTPFSGRRSFASGGFSRTSSDPEEVDEVDPQAVRFHAVARPHRDEQEVVGSSMPSPFCGAVCGAIPDIADRSSKPASEKRRCDVGDDCAFLLRQSSRVRHDDFIEADDVDANDPDNLEDVDWHSFVAEARRQLEVNSLKSTSPMLTPIPMAGGCCYYGDVLDSGSGKSVPHGSGRMCWPDGREYFGLFRCGQRVSGTMVWKDGRMYSGRWDKGQPHGRGTSFNPAGERWAGEWRSGRPLVRKEA